MLGSDPFLNLQIPRIERTLGAGLAACIRVTHRILHDLGFGGV